MIRSCKLCKIICGDVLESKEEKTITFTPAELESFFRKRDPVGAWINNPIIIWSLVIAVVYFTGSMMYQNINGGISTAAKAAAENTKVIDTLRDGLAEMQGTQRSIVDAMGRITDQLQQNSNRLFNVETTRFTDQDADTIRKTISSEKDALMREIDHVKDSITDLQDKYTELLSIKNDVAANKAALHERNAFMNDTRQEIKALNSDISQIKTRVDSIERKIP